MQKTFLGSELVKEKDKKKAQKKAVMPVSLRALKVLLGVIVGLVVWNLPSSVFGIENLTVIEQRVIAVSVLPPLCGLQRVFRRGQHRLP